MRERKPDTAYAVREAIPGLNYHELAMELYRTIDDASARIAREIEDAGVRLESPIDGVAKAIESLEARLETMEDELRRINSAIKELTV